jgi:hypothetical protein
VLTGHGTGQGNTFSVIDFVVELFDDRSSEAVVDVIDAIAIRWLGERELHADGAIGVLQRLPATV